VAAEEAADFKAAMKKVDEGKPRHKMWSKKKADKTNQLALGYRKFDGYTSDTKGETVHVRYAKKMDKKQEQRGIHNPIIRAARHS